MAPQNQADAQSLKDCVNFLRAMSSPRLPSGQQQDPRAGYIGAGQMNYLATGGGGIFIAPSEFFIKFLFKEQGGFVENSGIPKIGRCVLQHIDINYTPTGEWSTFHDGSPTSAMLTMAFLEMRIIDQDNILNNNY
jgi:hypothetical protein